MTIESAYFSRKGRKDKNDDSVLLPFCSNGVWWAAVADGMGGRPGGDVASKAAIDAIKSSVEMRHEADLSKLFYLAQARLQMIAKENPQWSSMGTTLSLISISNHTAQVGHVGDSRIYHLRGTGILDRTVDQTEVEQLVQQGVLSKARARRYPRRHVLLSILSPSREYELHKEKFEVSKGDRLVLLTDGVSSKMLRREIRDLSVDSPSPQSFCDSLASEIEKRLPQDDYSAVCLDVRS
jgi:serine/threonine protein phosphatase PrpC